MKLLQNDTALVTGAAGGIGRGIASALAEEGATVFGADLADADLAKAGEAARLAGEAIRRLGRVSIFVHAASPRRQEAQKALAVSEAQWREMLEVNLNAGFVLAQSLGLHMKENGIKGRMLFVTSPHAESPRNLPHYSAAKAGQTMLMKELARALGPHGIRVNAIAPGVVATERVRALLREDDPIRRKSIMGVSEPEDVAPLAVYLASEESRRVTGAILPVDAGASAI